MGLRYVKGLGGREREALQWAPPPYRTHRRLHGPHQAQEDRLPQRLAETGALDPLLVASTPAGFSPVGARLIWRRARDLELDSRTRSRSAHGDQAWSSGRPLFRQLGNAQEVFWDYRTQSALGAWSSDRQLAARQLQPASGIPTAQRAQRATGRKPHVSTWA